MSSVLGGGGIKKHSKELKLLKKENSGGVETESAIERKLKERS